MHFVTDQWLYSAARCQWEWSLGYCVCTAGCWGEQGGCNGTYLVLWLGRFNARYCFYSDTSLAHASSRVDLILIGIGRKGLCKYHHKVMVLIAFCNRPMAVLRCTSPAGRVTSRLCLHCWLQGRTRKLQWYMPCALIRPFQRQILFLQ